jgi:hypothetical protein
MRKLFLNVMDKADSNFFAIPHSPYLDFEREDVKQCEGCLAGERKLWLVPEGLKEGAVAA